MENLNEVKLMKFEFIVKESMNWLIMPMGEWKVDLERMGVERYYPNMPFCLPIYDKEKFLKYLDNQYFRKIYDICFFDFSKYTSYGLNSAIKDCILEPGVLAQEIRKLKNMSKCECPFPDPDWCWCDNVEYETSKIRGGIIFLGLLLAAVNEDFYNEQISMVSDLACMLEFTEEMMSDWITAVKYLLDGNKFCENMKLEFKTLEANLFFKHVGNSEAHVGNSETFEGSFLRNIKKFTKK